MGNQTLRKRLLLFFLTALFLLSGYGCGLYSPTSGSTAGTALDTSALPTDTEGSTSEAVTSSDTTSQDPSSDTTAASSETSETTTEPEAGDLDGYTIILDAGHGGRDSGCVFPFNNPEYNECDFTLRIALATKDELESRG
ncbi:MAG: N-acetylmuramoyl-L-alanine amidase, partial [Lachnospiraceae bacterium]|nr:N-acetylmuramoyl-L-alanine amidase [Lachnospiraceae bacterium]